MMEVDPSKTKDSITIFDLIDVREKPIEHLTWNIEQENIETPALKKQKVAPQNDEVTKQLQLEKSKLLSILDSIQLEPKPAQSDTVPDTQRDVNVESESIEELKQISKQPDASYTDNEVQQHVLIETSTASRFYPNYSKILNVIRCTERSK